MSLAPFLYILPLRRNKDIKKRKMIIEQMGINTNAHDEDVSEFNLSSLPLCHGFEIFQGYRSGFEYLNGDIMC